MIIPSREWLPTSVFLPGESHGQRSLVGYRPQGCKGLDMTEQLTHFLKHWATTLLQRNQHLSRKSLSLDQVRLLQLVVVGLPWRAEGLICRRVLDSRSPCACLLVLVSSGWHDLHLAPGGPESPRQLSQWGHNVPSMGWENEELTCLTPKPWSYKMTDHNLSHMLFSTPSWGDAKWIRGREQAPGRTVPAPGSSWGRRRPWVAAQTDRQIRGTTPRGWSGRRCVLAPSVEGGLAWSCHRAFTSPSVFLPPSLSFLTNFIHSDVLGFNNKVKSLAWNCPHTLALDQRWVCCPGTNCCSTSGHGSVVCKRNLFPSLMKQWSSCLLLHAATSGVLGLGIGDPQWRD